MKGIFIGYGSKNTFRAQSPQKNKIRVCNVKFDEKKNRVELLREKEIQNHDRKNDFLFTGLDNKNEEKELERENGIEGNVSESGDSDNDEERILEEFPKEDSTHMDKINEKKMIKICKIMYKEEQQ